MAILLAGLMAAFAMILLHWFPWKALIQRELPNLVRYLLGMLGIHVPLTYLFWLKGEWDSILALWLVTVIGGLAVVLAYGFDWLADMMGRLRAAEKENKQLRQVIRGKRPEER